MDPAIRLLRELVSINSVNPTLVPGAAGESVIAEAIAREMRAAGLIVEITVVRPDRPNVVGVVRGRRPGPRLMYCGHMDTVGVEGMRDPFMPIERDGRLFGRGAQDMKGGVVAMIDAARIVVATGGLSAGELIVAAVIDEEHESLGAEALVSRWRADAAVVTEPSDLAVAVAHKGFEWVAVTVEGRAAHGSRPSEGRDAILMMAGVLAGLGELNATLQRGTGHPLLGRPSLHASLIAGGQELSSYPERCTLRMERRTIPGETPRIALREVEQILEEVRKANPDFRAAAQWLFGRQPYEIDARNPLPELLEAALRRLGRQAERAGVTFWTDAAILGEAGIPTVIFGPGGAGLHSTEEFVRLDEVIACRDVLVELARAYCV
jgi:acetylornithine deacetylase